MNRATEPFAGDGIPTSRRSRIRSAAVQQAALIGGGVFVISMTAHFRTPLLPSIGRDLSMSAGQLGLATTAFAAGRLLMDVPAGRSADRIPASRAIGTAALVAAAAGMLLTFASASVWVFVAFSVLGIGSALCNTTGMTYFARVGPASSRGRMLAVYSGCLLVGQALGPTASGLIAGMRDWRAATAAGAGLGIVLACVMFLVRVVPDVHSRPHEPIGDPPDAALAPLETSRLVVLHTIPFVMFYTFGGIAQTLVPIVGDDRLGLGAGAIGLALGVGGVCRFIGAFVGGVVSDRISRKLALVPGMMVLAVGVTLVETATTPALWVMAIVVMSLASFPNSVGATILADHGGINEAGRRLGPYRLVGDVGLLVGPTVAGVVYQTTGGPGASLINAALLVTVALTAGLLLPGGWRSRA